MDHDVFISHSSKDGEAASQVCMALEEKEIRCWIAPRDVLPGADYGKSIIDALNDCQLFIIVFSSHSNSSPQVLREVERAVSKRLHIIPLRIEDIVPTGNMEYFISTTHWLDAFPFSMDQHLDRITSTIEGMLINQIKECTPAEGKEGAMDKNLAAFSIGRELSILSMYGESRTRGKLWMMRTLNDLGVDISQLKPFFNMETKESRLERFPKSHQIISRSITRSEGEETGSWLELGLSMTAIVGLLSEIMNGKVGGHIGSINTLMKTVEKEVEELQLSDHIELDPIRSLGDGDWLDGKVLENAYMSFSQNFITIEKRFEK